MKLVLEMKANANERGRGALTVLHYDFIARINGQWDTAILGTEYFYLFLELLPLQLRLLKLLSR